MDYMHAVMLLKGSDIKLLCVQRVFGLYMLQRICWRIAETNESTLYMTLISADLTFIDGVRGNWA